VAVLVSSRKKARTERRITTVLLQSAIFVRGASRERVSRVSSKPLKTLRKLVVPGGGFYFLSEAATAPSTSCSAFCNLSLVVPLLEAF